MRLDVKKRFARGVHPPLQDARVVAARGIFCEGARVTLLHDGIGQHFGIDHQQRQSAVLRDDLRAARRRPLVPD